MENRLAHRHGRGLVAPTRGEGLKQNGHDELEIVERDVAVVVVVECVSGPGGMVFGELQSGRPLFRVNDRSLDYLRSRILKPHRFECLKRQGNGVKSSDDCRLPAAPSRLQQPTDGRGHVG